MNEGFSVMEKYLQSCKSEFWQEVFKGESDYILHELKGAKEILSIGCGPAIIESGLAEHGFHITGLDISREALNRAPDSIRTVADSAEKTGFADGSFDAVIYIASLQFIEKYENAIKETVRILRSGGKLLVMLLNPQSEFFKQKNKDTTSYINRIKHINLKEVEEVITEYFSVETEYFLGIKETEIFASKNHNLASLYVIKGIKKQ
jgi:ubiquinone/menaquinone biosynthesis C-methylase UbiE